MGGRFPILKALRQFTDPSPTTRAYRFFPGGSCRFLWENHPGRWARWRVLRVTSVSQERSEVTFSRRKSPLRESPTVVLWRRWRVIPDLSGRAPVFRKRNNFHDVEIGFRRSAKHDALRDLWIPVENSVPLESAAGWKGHELSALGTGPGVWRRRRPAGAGASSRPIVFECVANVVEGLTFGGGAGQGYSG